MRGGAVYQEALRQLCAARLLAVAERDLVAVLEAGRPALPFLNELRFDCDDLDEEVVLHRAGALYALFCSGNLADDLIDGEATYLSEPMRFGPSAQFILHNLAVAHLLDAGVPATAMAAFAHELVQAGGPAHLENRTTQWDITTYRLVNDTAAGRQYAGFLHALWAGSAVAPKASAVGRTVGTASRIGKDYREKKDRLWSMKREDQVAAILWGQRLIADGRATGVRSACLVADALEGTLADALVTFRSAP